MKRILLSLVAGSSLALVACGADATAPPDVEITESALDGSLTTITDFGSNPGELGMKIFVPDGLPNHAPLVVAMHGCGGSPDVYAGPSGWTELAKKHGFALVFPVAHTWMKCFRIESPAHHTRGQGEALSIKQMVDWMKSRHSIDGKRIFATGFSSGAEMTNVMLGAYPDVFAAGGAVAGIPYRCATDQMSFGKCTTFGGRVLSAKEWGDRVREANPGNWTWPRMSLWHGTKDRIVASLNLDEEMKQWTDLNGIDQIPEVEEDVGELVHRVYEDASGEARVETYTMTDRGHMLPVDPGDGPEQCGRASLFTMSKDAGVCASYRIAKWFGIVP